MTARRVLVTGGRHYQDWNRVRETLDGLHRSVSIELLIQGGASGADRLAKRWAEEQPVPCATFDAPWESALRRRAGPVRNGWMLRYGRPNLVVAFPGNEGTADMVRQAREAGVAVVHVAP